MSLSEHYMVTKFLNSKGATQCPAMHAKGSQTPPKPRPITRGQW